MSAYKPDLDKIRAALAARVAEAKSAPAPVPMTPVAEATQSAYAQGIDKYGNVVTYNAKQREIIELVAKREHCVLLGPAGTGKTTVMRGVANMLQDLGLPPLRSEGHKHLRDGAPGVIFTSFTNRAVQNIAQALGPEYAASCVTIHKLLEYGPHFYEVIDPHTLEAKTTMRFEPSRCAANPLPNTIHTIVMEESSMIGTDLWDQLEDALSHEVQFIFIGDIQQLQPVFGPAILGYKMLEYPAVELDEVYRSAGSIIDLATQIRLGQCATYKEKFTLESERSQVIIHPWKKKLTEEAACKLAAAFMSKLWDSGEYDPEQDQILIPFNKGFGTIEFNKWLATHIAHAQHKVVYQIRAGFASHHYAIGDRILYGREDAVVVGIQRNAAYWGVQPADPSEELDYWGVRTKADGTKQAAGIGEMDADAILDAIRVSKDTEERVLEASHTLKVYIPSRDQVVDLHTAGEINTCQLAYAITVHKSQGAEWRKVFFLTYHGHASMLQRELVYTACTRARELLYVIGEPDLFDKGVRSQKVKGTTLAEKAQYFRGKGYPANPRYAALTQASLQIEDTEEE